MVIDYSFLKFLLLPESLNFIVSSKSCQLSLMWQVYLFSRRCLPNTQVWKWKMSMGQFSRKNGVPWRKVAILARNLNNHTVLFSELISHFNMQRCFMSTSHFCYTNIKKTHSQRLRLNTINNSYYSARPFLGNIDFFFCNCLDSHW